MATTTEELIRWCKMKAQYALLHFLKLSFTNIWLRAKGKRQHVCYIQPFPGQLNETTF